jgi:hypothetical protein
MQTNFSSLLDKENDFGLCYLGQLTTEYSSDTIDVDFATGETMFRGIGLITKSGAILFKKPLFIKPLTPYSVSLDSLIPFERPGVIFTSIIMIFEKDDIFEI